MVIFSFAVFISALQLPPPISPYCIRVLFVMRLLKASCHLEEGPAAASDKWITDGIHPPGQTGPVDNRIRDRLPTRITKKFRLLKKMKVKKQKVRRLYLREQTACFRL